MDKVRLEMDFLDALEKLSRITLDDPREDLIPSEIEGAMQNIIANNIFETKNGDLVGISGARLVTTNINEMEF